MTGPHELTRQNRSGIGQTEHRVESQMIDRQHNRRYHHRLLADKTDQESKCGKSTHIRKNLQPGRAPEPKETPYLHPGKTTLGTGGIPGLILKPEEQSRQKKSAGRRNAGSDARTANPHCRSSPLAENQHVIQNHIETARGQIHEGRMAGSAHTAEKRDQRRAHTHEGAARDQRNKIITLHRSDFRCVAAELNQSQPHPGHHEKNQEPRAQRQIKSIPGSLHAGCAVPFAEILRNDRCRIGRERQEK